jgi:serine/threonine-protein kinase
VDLPLRHPAVSRLAGEIVAATDHWLISNFSATRTYVIENPQGAGEYIKVAPRRLGAPVPFEFSRVVIPVNDGSVDFMVYAPEHTYAAPPPTRSDSEPTVAAFSLDETSKYFLVLVALCEPRLRDSSSIAIPLVPEVVERLRPLPSCRNLSRFAVNYHVAYLAESKLRIRQRTSTPDEAKRLDWKREAVVSFALRFDLVQERHLVLLPSRRTRA